MNVADDAIFNRGAVCHESAGSHRPTHVKKKKEKEKRKKQQFNPSLGLQTPRASSLWQAQRREDKSLPSFVLELWFAPIRTHAPPEHQTRGNCVLEVQPAVFFSELNANCPFITCTDTLTAAMGYFWAEFLFFLKYTFNGFTAARSLFLLHFLNFLIYFNIVAIWIICFNFRAKCSPF